MNLTASHRLQFSWITWSSRPWFSFCPGSPGPLPPAWNSCRLCRSGPGSASPRSPRGDDHRHPAPSHRRHRRRGLTLFATRWPRAYGGRIINKTAVGALRKCTWHKWFVFVFVTLGILEWLRLPQGVVWTSRPLTRLPATVTCVFLSSRPRSPHLQRDHGTPPSIVGNSPKPPSQEARLIEAQTQPFIPRIDQSPRCPGTLVGPEWPPLDKSVGGRDPARGAVLQVTIVCELFMYCWLSRLQKR